MYTNKILTELPTWKDGSCKEKINWKQTIGMQLDLLYKGKVFTVTVVNYNKLILWIDYNGYVYDKGIFIGNFIKGNFGNILKLNTRKFKVDIGERFKSAKRDLVITDNEYRLNKNSGQNYKWYKYMCNNCGWTEGWIVENDLKNGKGCACCRGFVVVPNINSIKTKAPWMTSLGVSDEDSLKYTPQSSKKIKVKCPDCGKKKDIIIRDLYINKSIGCTCGDKKSFVSKYICSVLDQLQLDYKTEVKYDWNKYINPKNNKLTQARIDFVIYYNNREIPLEADGGFHRQDNNMNGITADMQQSIDEQRDKNCLKYLDEETIRISDEGDVRENILNSKLNELFDLSTIDWVKCEKFALKNIVKEVCDYWNTKEEWETTTSIAKVFNLNKTTIIDYLKKGIELGWADYDPNEELIKSGKRTGLKYVGSCNSPKPVEAFKDGISVGVFESASHLSRISENLLGINLLREGISNVCIGKRKHHKGFTFKYVL